MAVSPEKLREEKNNVLQRNTTESKVSTMYHSQYLTKQRQITRCIKKQKMLASIKRKDNHQWRLMPDNQDVGISRKGF